MASTNTPSPNPPAGEGPLRFAFIAKPLIVLTQDESLLAVLQAVTDPAHEVWPAASEIDLSTVLMAHHAGVIVLDCAAVAAPIATFTQRLHSQFPDLVLIVAGGVAEQATLAAQITDGSVYRFLHKPFSEQRVRLFVEAAWRRQAQAPPEPAPLARQPRAKRWWLLVAVLALCGGIGTALVWMNTREPQVAARDTPRQPPVKTPAAAADAALENLLSRADRALAAGALIAPPGDNAAELYRQALERSPHDPRASSGLEQLVERLLTAAEAQLQEHNLDAAQQLVTQAHAINPDHPRVAFLTAQIGAQSARAAAGKEQELAKDQATARALVYVSRARDAMGRDRLIDPPQDNARVYVESAAALAPEEPQVMQAKQDLLMRLQDGARAQLEAKNADQAESLTAAAAVLGDDPALIAALRNAAQQVRLAARADASGRLSAAFNQRLEAGHLIEPSADSAKFYLAQLTQEDAASPATQLARNAYATRVLEEARAALRAQDFTAARRWLDEARGAGADAAQTGALETALGTAQDAAQQASSYVNESTLTRTHYVAPRFPDAASQRGMDGWVDLQFMVDPDGSVSDVAVIGAQPAGIFEPAALEALRQWRYQPLVRGGQNVSQRARVRVRFKVQP